MKRSGQGRSVPFGNLYMGGIVQGNGRTGEESDLFSASPGQGRLQAVYFREPPPVARVIILHADIGGDGPFRGDKKIGAEADPQRIGSLTLAGIQPSQQEA